MQTSATASGIVIGNGVSLFINYAGTAVGGAIGGRGGYETVSFGATATMTVVSGEQDVLAGTVTSVTIGAGGLQRVQGTAVGTTVKSGGEQDLTYFSGLYPTVASGTVVGNGGIQQIEEGVASNTTVLSGGEIILAGGTTVGLTISKGGIEAVGAGDSLPPRRVRHGTSLFLPAARSASLAANSPT